MTQRTAVVTGATHGIGYSTVDTLLERNFEVICISRDLDNRFETDPLFQHHNVTKIKFNFENVKDIKKIDLLTDHISVLVNNVGMMPLVEFEETTVDTLWQMFNVNLISAIEMSKLCLPKMHVYDSIVNVASVSGVENEDYLIPYAVTKAGLIHFTKCLAKKWPDIRINSISPGLTKTNLVGGDIPSEFLDDIPMKRIATPQEVAKCIMNIISTPYMTGTNTILDGGKTL